MDMHLFDKPIDNIKDVKGKRNHQNKKSFSSDLANDLRKKANRREKPRERIEYDEDEYIL